MHGASPSYLDESTLPEWAASADERRRRWMGFDARAREEYR